MREKQRTPGGISRIIYLKWQRRFSETRTASSAPQTGHLALFDFFFIFFAPVPFTHNARLRALLDPRASPPPLSHCHTITVFRGPSQSATPTLYSWLAPTQYITSTHVIRAFTTQRSLPTHVSSPSSSHDSSSVSPSMSSTSRTASLRSKTQATLRPVLPFSASETSPLIHPASTYDRLIGMRTEAICKHVSSSEIGRLSSLPAFHTWPTFRFSTACSISCSRESSFTGPMGCNSW